MLTEVGGMLSRCGDDRFSESSRFSADKSNDELFDSSGMVAKPVLFVFL